MSLRKRLRYGGLGTKATNIRLYIGWKIRQWWDGEYEDAGEDPDSGVQFFRLTGNRSTSSNIAHVLAEFYLRNWQWLWGTAIVIVLAFVAL